MTNLMLVDDHVILRQGLRNMLKQIKGFTVVAEAGTGEEALRVLRKHLHSATLKRPDVILMDIRMPIMDGVEAARRMLRLDPDLCILGLTGCTDHPVPTRFLQAGAAGYITKDCDLELLVQAIRKVATGQRYISAEVAQQIAFHSLTDTPIDESPLDRLSERELQVLLMITSGCRVQEISDQLCLSPKTVNSYRYRLFEKLNVTNDVFLTHIAIKYGLIDKDVIMNLNQHVQPIVNPETEQVD